jgi:sulfite exporter TauE/SafE
MEEFFNSIDSIDADSEYFHGVKHGFFIVMAMLLVIGFSGQMDYIVTFVDLVNSVGGMIHCLITQVFDAMSDFYSTDPRYFTGLLIGNIPCLVTVSVMIYIKKTSYSAYIHAIA